MTISFIIAAYNAENYIAKCIRSCLNCSIKGKEIIIINDGSTDQTLDICKRIQSNNPTLIKIINQANKGVSVARNTGIKYASGEWLLFVDADDTINGDALYKILSSSLITTNEINICTFSCSFIFKEKTEIHSVKNKIYNIDKFLNSSLFQLATWNYLFKRKFIISNHIEFPVGVICAEDQNFNLKAMCCSEQIISFNETVYNYNCTNQYSASQKKHSLNWIESRLKSANDLLAFCIKASIPTSIIYNQIKRFYESYMNDNTTNISFSDKKVLFKKEYQLSISMLPSFKDVWKFKICNQCFWLGSFMFYIHRKIVNKIK